MAGQGPAFLHASQPQAQVTHTCTPHWKVPTHTPAMSVMLCSAAHPSPCGYGICSPESSGHAGGGCFGPGSQPRRSQSPHPVAGRVRRLGVQHGGAGGHDPAHPIRALHDGLEVHRGARPELTGAQPAPAFRRLTRIPGCKCHSPASYRPCLWETPPYGLEMLSSACRPQAEWEAEFAKYKSSPEYQKINRYAWSLLHEACLSLLCHALWTLVNFGALALCVVHADWPPTCES